jgi:hypothetical protein
LTVTVGNANVGVAVTVGVNANVGVRVFVGVTVKVGVEVFVSAAVAVMAVAVTVDGSSVEGAQAETNRKIMKALRTIFN